MRKLVQKLVELEPYLSNNKELLQAKLDELSKDGWELCGQVGLFHIFKRWEEEVKVYQNGYDSQPNYQPGYYGNNYNSGFNGYGYGNYNNYRPPFQQQYYNNYNNNNYGYRPQPYNNGYQPQPSFNNYNPGMFGTPVSQNQNNPFNNSKEDKDDDED